MTKDQEALQYIATYENMLAQFRTEHLYILATQIHLIMPTVAELSYAWGYELHPNQEKADNVVNRCTLHLKNSDKIIMALDGELSITRVRGQLGALYTDPVAATEMLVDSGLNNTEYTDPVVTLLWLLEAIIETAGVDSTGVQIVAKPEVLN